MTIDKTIKNTIDSVRKHAKKIGQYALIGISSGIITLSFCNQNFKEIFNFYRIHFDNNISYSSFSRNLYKLHENTIEDLKDIYKRSYEDTKKCLQEHAPLISKSLDIDSLEFAVHYSHLLSYEEFQKRKKINEEWAKRDFEEIQKLKDFFKNAYNNNEDVYVMDTTLFRIGGNNISHIQITPYKSEFIYDLEKNPILRP